MVLSQYGDWGTWLLFLANLAIKFFNRWNMLFCSICCWISLNLSSEMSRYCTILIVSASASIAPSITASGRYSALKVSARTKCLPRQSVDQFVAIASSGLTQREETFIYVSLDGLLNCLTRGCSMGSVSAVASLPVVGDRTGLLAKYRQGPLDIPFLSFLAYLFWNHLVPLRSECVQYRVPL